MFPLWPLLPPCPSQSLVKDSLLTWADMSQVIHFRDVNFFNESICEDLRGFLVFCVSGGPGPHFSPADGPST
jgi:hypothetical protein